MKWRLWIWVATALIPGVMAGLSRDYAEFGKGPAKFIMTLPERATWKRLKDDGEAKEFIDAFWARRDPSYRTLFDKAVAFANEKFVTHRIKSGSLTDMGRVLVILGPPTHQVWYEMLSFERPAPFQTPIPFERSTPFQGPIPFQRPVLLELDEIDTKGWPTGGTLCWFYEAKGFDLEPRIPRVCFQDWYGEREWILLDRDLERSFEDVNRSRLRFDTQPRAQPDSKD